LTRVVVTGLGPVATIGVGRRAFADGLRAGRDGFSRIRAFNPEGFPQELGGEVHDFAPAALLRRLDVRDWGRTSLLAAAAARLAWEDAGLSADDAAAGVVCGTTGGESHAIEAQALTVQRAGYAAQDPEILRLIDASRLATAIATELELTGETLTIATACAASNYTLGYALDCLQRGDAEVMIAAGAEAISRAAHAGFCRLGVLAKDMCRPFDKDRSGLLLGEGGAALVVETEAHARARGARIYAEVLGYGVNCDARHMTAADVDTVAACIRAAHAAAGVAPAEVDYVCAHGTGTPANDQTEYNAMRAVFGDRLPPTSAIKSMLGHTLGAASGFGAIASVLAIAEGFLPPTLHWRTPDPGMPGLDPVPNEARAAAPRVVQNNGFAFGGNNAIVIFGRAA
jgi:3-oxoacyl-[acyl-carrier-protein] synthase II